MKVTFSLVKDGLKVPRSYKAFKTEQEDGFVICTMVILKSSDKKNIKVGYKKTFKGTLPSCAPYFQYTCNLKQCKDSTHCDTFEVDRYGGDLKCERAEFDVSVIRYMLNVELASLSSEDFEKGQLSTLKKALQVYLNEYSSSVCTLSHFKEQSFFTDTPILLNCCDYFRVEKEMPLIQLFGQKGAQGIRTLPNDKLDTMLHFAFTKPWLLCFERWSTLMFNVKPLKLSQFVKNRVETTPTIMNALRTVDAMYAARKTGGHTLFSRSIIHGSTEEEREAVMQYLLYQVVYRMPDAPHLFAFLSNYAHAQKIVDRLKTTIDCQVTDSHLLRQGSMVPCKSVNIVDMSREQRQFISHVLNSENRIVLLQGGPGTGKSEVGLTWFMSAFRAPLPMTITGMMVDAGHRRMGGRVETMYTIHYILQVSKKIEHARKWLQNFNIVVFDEASNIDTALFASILDALPPMCKIVLIGDLGQIFPISPGCPFHDLVSNFPQHCIKLTENKRVNANSRALADASYEIATKNTITIPDDNTMHDSPLSIVDISDDNMNDILDLYVRDISDVMDMHIIVLRNQDRRRINKYVEQYLFSKGYLKSSAKQKKISHKLTLIKGQKITFTRNTTPKVGDSVRNGELGQVFSFTYDRKHGGTMISLTNGKTIFLHNDKGIPAKIIELGYASTANKAQGSEWRNIVFYMYTGCSQQQFWCKSHPYVAISRAKQKCVVMGNMNELKRLCLRDPPRRCTVLNHLLKSVVHPAVDTSSQILEDNIHRLQLMPKTIPAIPRLQDFKPKKTKKK